MDKYLLQQYLLHHSHVDDAEDKAIQEQLSGVPSVSVTRHKRLQNER